MRATTWHAESWNRCIGNRLPELLFDRIGFASYRVERDGQSHTLHMSVLDSRGHEIPLVCGGIPAISDDGVFMFQEQEVIIVPLADDETLRTVSCCGEQLLEFLDPRIVTPPDGFITGKEVVESWLPLSDWIREFFLERSQVLDTQNAVARMTHLNRIIVESVGDVAPAVQLGLACPLETPEGPNLGRVLTVAKGAVIENGTVRSVETGADSMLGPTASMIPFIERSDPARLLMGTNMMRQWIPPRTPEPPMVVTGTEPDGIVYANGYNLLTAFLSLGAATSEDGLVLSRSAADRMRYDDPVAAGDKFSNRSGQKGVVSEIWPDDRMPRLADGTPVDLVCGVAGLHTRMNTGQLFEALAGRIASSTGEPFSAPPFSSPSRSEISEKLVSLGFEASGMEPCSIPGREEPVRTIAGWIYWGRTKHITSRKIYYGTEPGEGQRFGAMEYWMLRDAGCRQIIRETVGLKASDHPDAATLVQRIRSGDLDANGESMPFRRLASILKRGGIDLTLDEGRLSATWNTGGDLVLARPVRHPWSMTRLVDRLPGDGVPSAVRSENERLTQLVGSSAPDSIIEQSRCRLERLISDYVNRLFSTETNDCLPTGRPLLSGRSVIVPSDRLSADEVGIPMEMIERIVLPALGKDRGMSDRDLAGILKDVRVCIDRAPTDRGTSIIGFRPVPVEHQAIELNPLYCRWLRGDFDGDQVAVFALVTEAGQREAGELLSPAGHIARSPETVRALIPPHEALWGMVDLWRDAGGRARLEAALGVPLTATDTIIRFDELVDAFEAAFRTYGAEDALARMTNAMKLGFDASLGCGAMSPLVRLEFDIDDSDDHIKEAMLATIDIDDPAIGHQFLYPLTGIRGSLENFVRLHVRRDGSTPVGLLDGVSSPQLGSWALDVRAMIAGLFQDIRDISAKHNAEHLSRSNNLLARAARSEKPGVVFGSAADRGETDPLTDIDAALFVGIID